MAKHYFPDDDTLRFVTCALCEETILGESCRAYWVNLHPAERLRQPIVDARVDGRPYCAKCMRVKIIRWDQSCGASYWAYEADDGWHAFWPSNARNKATLLNKTEADEVLAKMAGSYPGAEFLIERW